MKTWLFLVVSIYIMNNVWRSNSNQNLDQIYLHGYHYVAPYVNPHPIL